MITVLTTIGIVAGAVTGLGAIWRLGLVPLYRGMKKMEQAHDIILEFPEWKEGVDQSLQMLYPNSGASIHDKVTRIEASLCETKREVQELKEQSSK